MSRQARRARQEPDAQRLKREITVFPALAQTYTKNDERHDADAGIGESVEFMERSGSGINHTVSPLGREADQSVRPRKIWKAF